MSNYPPFDLPPGRRPAREPGRGGGTGRNTRRVEPLGSGEESGRSETRDRVLGALAAVVGVALVVLAVFAMTGSLGSKAEPTDSGAAGQESEPAPNPSATEEPPPATSAAPPSTQELDPNAKAPLTVLNASSVSGLAAGAAATYEQAGWIVNEVGTLSEGNVQVTTVYYTEGSAEEEAAATALQAQFPQIQQVAVRPSSIDFQGVVVVLTGDYKI